MLGGRAHEPLVGVALADGAPGRYSVWMRDRDRSRQPRDGSATETASLCNSFCCSRWGCLLFLMPPCQPREEAARLLSGKALSTSA